MLKCLSISANRIIDASSIEVDDKHHRQLTRSIGEVLWTFLFLRFKTSLSVMIMF